MRDDRPQYQALLASRGKRHIDVVLVWRYDRFARSTQALVQALNEFHRLGVDFISYQENIDTTTPQGELIFTVMASLAQFESALISERVRAGMARAKAQASGSAGTTCGEHPSRHCHVCMPGHLDPSDQQATQDWIRDRMELTSNASRQGTSPRVRSIHPPDGSWSSLCYWRVMGALREGTVNFPAITPGTPK